MSPEEDEDDTEYGEWHVYDVETALARDKQAFPPAGSDDIWPNWREGVPKKLRRTGWAPSFFSGSIRYHPRSYTDTLELI